MAEDTTALLAVAREGDARAHNTLFEQVYDELRRLAGSRRRDSHDATVSTTGLVHEAYLKMVGASGPWENRRHFMRVAAGAMRQVLIDRARARRALKRGVAPHATTLDDTHLAVDATADHILDIHDALDRLAARAGAVVVTCGADGVVAARGDERLALPTVPVMPVDAVGAGDSFNAGFLSRFVAGAPFEACLHAGLVAGAFSTTAGGGTAAFDDHDAYSDFAARAEAGRVPHASHV